MREVKTMVLNIERVNAQLDELARTGEQSRAEELRSQIREQIAALIRKLSQPRNGSEISADGKTSRKGDL